MSRITRKSTRKIKLKKNKRQNRTSKNKMIGGNTKRNNDEINESDESDKIIKRSKRGLPTLTIPVIYLGKGTPITQKYNKQNFGDKGKEHFISEGLEKIKPGYQIVCIPMPPHESHSIIVNRGVNDSIKIVEWGGNQMKRQDEIKDRINEIIKEKQKKISKKNLKELEEEQAELEETVKKWYNYTLFINSLISKFGEVEYEPKDEAADIQACIRFDTDNGHGGCSEYVHNWLELHLGKDDEGEKIQSLLFTTV